MSLNFPASPAPGQVYQAEGATFIWNGTVWTAQGANDPFPWASNADGVQGTRRDVFLTPASAKAFLDARPPAVPASMGTPTNMLASRTWNTTYTNNTGRPMLVTIWATMGSVGGWIRGLVGAGGTAGQTLQIQTQFSGSAGAGLCFVVPPGWGYRLERSFSGGSIGGWVEWR